MRYWTPIPPIDARAWPLAISPCLLRATLRLAAISLSLETVHASRRLGRLVRQYGWRNARGDVPRAAPWAGVETRVDRAILAAPCGCDVCSLRGGEAPLLMSRPHKNGWLLELDWGQATVFDFGGKMYHAHSTAKTRDCMGHTCTLCNARTHASIMI